MAAIPAASRIPAPAGPPDGRFRFDWSQEMPYYRYRTATLVGPWRDSRLKAECDAVATGQAEFAGGRGQFQWKVAGEIELQSAETKSAGA